MLLKVLTTAGRTKGYFNTSCIQGSTSTATAITFILGGNNGGRDGANQIQFEVNMTEAQWDAEMEKVLNPPFGSDRALIDLNRKGFHTIKETS